jgi:hypothetical protein
VLTGAGVIRTISKYRQSPGERSSIPHDQRGIAEQKFNPTRHGIRIHAHGINSLGAEHATECHLGADTIAIRALMTNDHDPLTTQFLQQIGPPTGKLRIIAHGFFSA